MDMTTEMKLVESLIYEDNAIYVSVTVTIKPVNILNLQTYI